MADAASTAHAGYRIDLRPPLDKKDVMPDQRDRLTRWLYVGTVCALTIGVPALIAQDWASTVGLPEVLTYIASAIAGTTIGAIGISSLHLFIYNPEWQAYVTQNAFTGEMIPYGPGLHPSFSWEERNRQGNYSLQVITRTFEVQVQTKTARVTVKGKYEYAINLSVIEKAIGVDSSTIETGLTAFISSFLTDRCAGEDAETVRKNVKQYNEALAAEFMAAQTPQMPDKTPATFGDNYGFRTVAVVIDSISFPEAVQKARDSIDEADAIHQVMAKLAGMTPAEFAAAQKTMAHENYINYLNRAMAISDNATLKIDVIEGNIASGAAALLVNALGKSGGPGKGKPK